MSDIYSTGATPRCGDPETLIAYAYGEIEPVTAAAFSEHLAGCGACTVEVAALGATRQQLASWTPPQTALNFRVIGADLPAPAIAAVPLPMAADVDSSAPTGAVVLRPARWWNRPLPGWAQAAAAVVIFTTGMALGAARNGVFDQAATAGVPVAATAAASTAGAGAATVTAADLARVESVLRNELAQMKAAGAAPGATQTAAAAPEANAVIRQVQALIAESEQRQRRELALRTAEVMRDFDLQRTNDLMRIEQRMGNIQTLTGAQRQDLEYLARRVGLSR